MNANERKLKGMALMSQQMQYSGEWFRKRSAPLRSRKREKEMSSTAAPWSSDLICVHWRSLADQSLSFTENRT
jgi:hypothetical protein